MSTDANKKEVIYFIGIGGIGMSALARYFKFHGNQVSGYDKTATALTKQLEAEGIEVHYEENLDLIPKQPDVIVYTPAIPAAHKELQYYKEQGFQLLKRSEVLGYITNKAFNICVAGTHGKTTTTTMVAHILRDSEYGCNAFLGGIAANYNSNYWSHERNVCVVEADEYDRSFLKLSPDIAIITAMDPDHLDIYGTPEAMEESFIEFSSKLKKDGLLISKYGLKRGAELKGPHHWTYHREDSRADVYSKNRTLEQGGYRFDVVINGTEITDIYLPMGGLHNVENVTAAIAVAHFLGITDEKIRAAVSSFKGVKRRFEYIIRTEELVVVDDYAHHPEELHALISSAKNLFPDYTCTVLFQPHLFTRTRDFIDGFASVLSEADETVLLPIYPARELPIEGVTSDWLLSKLTNKQHFLLEKNAVVDWVKKNKKEKQLIIIAGAGDIDTLVLPIKEALEA
ncbi:MAG: UDP-N-acetylmuramate--L-alanine ligase [Chitinophagaceae bacterium]|nr:UDP-N-acetylmuramate--L-alanine ligase [Chitinophagaceae bacterium]